MALRASELIAYFEHALGNAAIDNFATLSLVNQAGAWLCSSHPWKHLERPPYRLNLRGTITITAATWDEASLTLTVTDPLLAFEDYAHLEGDQLEIESGTGADPGFIDVMSATTSAIVLRTSIGAAADGQTDIAGQLQLPAARLPNDLQELIAVQCCGVAGSNVTLVTPAALVNIKTDNTSTVDTDFYGAVLWGASVGVNGGPPIPRLELWPPPSVDDSFSIMIHYRAGWQRLTTDDAYSNTPDWFDSLVIQAMRAYAKGLENHMMDEELGRIKGSAMYDDARRRDGSIQRKLGRMRGGAVAQRMRYGDPRVGNWIINLPP